MDVYGICSSLTGQISKKLNHLKIKTTCVIQNCWHFSDNCPQRCQEWLYKLRVSLAINSTVNSAVQQLLSLKAWHVLNASVSGDGESLCHFPLMHLSFSSVENAGTEITWRSMAKEMVRANFIMSKRLRSLVLKHR